MILDRQNIPYEEVVMTGRCTPRPGHSLHDPCTERAFLQRRRLCMYERLLMHSDNKKMELAKDDMYILHPLPQE